MIWDTMGCMVFQYACLVFFQAKSAPWDISEASFREIAGQGLLCKYNIGELYGSKMGVSGEILSWNLLYTNNMTSAGLTMG